MQGQEVPSEATGAFTATKRGFSNSRGAFFAMQGLSERAATELKVRSWTKFENKG